MPSLRKDTNLEVEVVETTGLIGVLRFNQPFPPFVPVDFVGGTAAQRLCLAL